MRSQMSPRALQQLRHVRDVVRNVLALPSTSFREGDVAPDAIRRICQAFDALDLRPADLPVVKCPGIAYLDLVRSDEFDLGIFVLPPDSVLPYHNHPNMTVFTRVIQGAVHICSLDWVEGAPAVNDNGALSGQTAVKTDAVKDPSSPTWYLTPTSGNVHRLKARQHSAMIDLLVPPYSAELGGYRRCSYFADDGHGHLDEIDEPADLDIHCYEVPVGP
ncbi:Cysteine dioxygenase [Plasmodiophora brassicae]|nr:hypothetical protein PBRA_007828 [Plasmodiophora brassicae]